MIILYATWGKDLCFYAYHSNFENFCMQTFYTPLKLAFLFYMYEDCVSKNSKEQPCTLGVWLNLITWRYRLCPVINRKVTSWLMKEFLLSSCQVQTFKQLNHSKIPVEIIPVFLKLGKFKAWGPQLPEFPGQLAGWKILGPEV